MGYSYDKPYTKKGVYYAGDSGLSEQDFLSQRAAGTLSNRNRFDGNDQGEHFTAAGNTIDLRLPDSATGSGTTDAPWWDSMQQASPTGIFARNADWDKPNFGRGWERDQNLVNVSKAIPQMLGYNEATGKYDDSKGSIIGGPGQAYSDAELGQLYGLGSQALRRTNSATMAGIANQQASRGGAGLNAANLFAGRDAADRGALAKANLDARTQGYNLGVDQYNSKLAGFNQISNIANAEADRFKSLQALDFSKLLADKQQQANAVENARQGILNFRNQYGVELSSGSGAEGKSGSLKDNLRRQLQDLQRMFQYAQANYSQYA